MHQYFGIWSDFGFVLLGLSALVLSIGSVWEKRKRMSIHDRDRVDSSSRERLERIEQIVEASALEIERMAEHQRYAARLVAQRGANLPVGRLESRHVTPH